LYSLKAKGENYSDLGYKVMFSLKAKGENYSDLGYLVMYTLSRLKVRSIKTYRLHSYIVLSQGKR